MASFDNKFLKKTFAKPGKLQAICDRAAPFLGSNRDLIEILVEGVLRRVRAAFCVKATLESATPGSVKI